MHLRDEIHEQPEVIARLLERGLDLVAPVAEQVRRAGIEHVVIAARGTSDHAAIYAQYLWGVRNRLTVALAVADSANPYRYLQIRGRVVELTETGADAHIDRLAKKYLNVEIYPYRRPGEVRVIVRIRPERVQTVG